MATMIPENVEEFTTNGERQTYRFLQSVAKPDKFFICWYLPDIDGNEPDFILYSRENGLIVLEVKDWSLDQIHMADPLFFVLNIGGQTEKRKNPLKQAKDYLHSILQKIKIDGKLVSRDPEHQGNPKLPVGCGVVFPNINKFEYREKGLHRVIDTNKCFFWDDLHPSSDLCSDPSETSFGREISSRFPKRFTFQLTGAELDHLRQLIFPVVKIELPQRECGTSYRKRICRFKGLDRHQEVLARKFESGHRILIGPSGCGKTLILIHKSACLLRYNSKIQSILFVCYNITLVNYIQRLLALQNVPFGKEGVRVKHFYQLCSEILGETVEYENQDSDYYEIVAQETLEKVENWEMRFDAVLIDEGQDFSDTMLKVLTALLNPATDNLTIALDERQNLYHKRSPWKELGVKARGRVHRIDYVYRNTVEISELASCFSGRLANRDSADSSQLSLFPDFFDFHGPKPVFTKFLDINEVVLYTADEIGLFSGTDDCPYSEIAVLYTIKRPFRKEKHLPEMLKEAFAAKGIPSRWASENYQSKRTYDITTDSVTISTIHSAKGMDFSCVFLLGLDHLEPKGWTENQIENLVYVGITRARYRLLVPYVTETPLIRKILSCCTVYP